MSYYLFNLFEFCYNGLNPRLYVISHTYDRPLYRTILEYTKSYFLFNLIDAELREITPKVQK